MNLYIPVFHVFFGTWLYSSIYFPVIQFRIFRSSFVMTRESKYHETIAGFQELAIPSDKNLTAFNPRMNLSAQITVIDTATQKEKKYGAFKCNLKYLCCF